MEERGIGNLGILVGADVKRGVKTSVEATWQEGPGGEKESILAGRG